MPVRAPELFGNTTQVSIQARFAQTLPARPPVDPVTLQTSVVVMPHHAQVAQRHFIDTASQLARRGLPLPAPRSASAEIPPLLPERRTTDPADTMAQASDLQSLPRSTPAAVGLAPAAVSTPQIVGSEPAHLPELLDNAPPNYPQEAVRNGWQGTVVLRVRVTTGGEVGELTITSSSGIRLLDAAAVAAVKRWRFRPGHRGGQPVETTVRLPVVFSLSERRGR